MTKIRKRSNTAFPNLDSWKLKREAQSEILILKPLKGG